MGTSVALPAMFYKGDFLPSNTLLSFEVTMPKDKALIRALAKQTLSIGKYTVEDFKSDFVIFLCSKLPSPNTSLEQAKRNIKKEYDSIGLRASISKCEIEENGEMALQFKTFTRVQCDKFIRSKPFFIAKVKPIQEFGINKKTKRLEQSILVKIRQLIGKKLINDQWIQYCREQEDASTLADTLISNIYRLLAGKSFMPKTLRSLFCDLNVNARLETVYNKLENGIEEIEQEEAKAKLKQELEENTKQEQKKDAREYVLRQQMKAVKKELGEEDDGSGVEDYKKRIKDAKMPEEAETKAKKELKRLEQMNPLSAETTVSRTYLDWLVDLPWSIMTEDILDISRTKKILDEDHYGLDKPKKRVVEYVAVRKLAPNKKAPIICFVGPPGVGKTSLGKSIARAMGRKFVRISLGGVKDEAEIRGHRRTYVGALPGRIIQGLKKAGTKNPVFMLDEIDKLDSDFRGDPASALLEALDPEQNHSFSDHYLEVVFDLSQVTFLVTANSLRPIPPALLDRLEVKELPGYTYHEKIKIAKQFLLPKQLEEHGLTGFEPPIELSDDAILGIIENYTFEAGVRNLERGIATVLRRGAAVPIASNKKPKTPIVRSDLNKILGVEEFEGPRSIEITEPGVVNCLSATQVGGSILRVCATQMPGKGRLIATGRLAKVITESSQLAFSWVRNYSDREGLNIDFSKIDIHIQFEENSIGKDGPSAGAAMALCFASLFTGRKVRSDVALTGELTFRSNGTVLPVGAIKEKILAAERSGFKHVMIPRLNVMDLVDVSDDIKRKINIMPINLMPEVLDFALLPKTE
ncbi:endopeptidase La [Patescibacteria group bacterium]